MVGIIVRDVYRMGLFRPTGWLNDPLVAFLVECDNFIIYSGIKRSCLESIVFKGNTKDMMYSEDPEIKQLGLAIAKNRFEKLIEVYETKLNNGGRD